jgi:hypothetical protein
VSAVADSGALQQFAPGDDQIAEEVARAQRLRLDDSRGAASWRVTRANVDAWWEARWYLDFAGLVLAIVAVYMLGRLVGGYLGRRLLAAFESQIQCLAQFVGKDCIAVFLLLLLQWLKARE